MKESAVPSVWPLCPLGAQTGVVAAAGKPPSSSIRDPSRPAAQPRQERPVPAGPVNSPPSCACHRALGTSLVCRHNCANWQNTLHARVTVQGVGCWRCRSGPGSWLGCGLHAQRPAPFGNTSSSRFRR